jgi:hypothetical protein
VPLARALQVGEALATARGDHEQRAGRPSVPPLRALHDAGVRVFAGNDNIRDCWWPYGNGDLLQRAMLLGYRSGFYTDADLMLALDMVTTHAAQVIGLPQHGIAEGRPATFVAVRADHGPAAVAGCRWSAGWWSTAAGCRSTPCMEGTIAWSHSSTHGVDPPRCRQA